MSKTVTWQLRKLLVAILLCVTFFAFATACGGSVTGNEDPGQENASVLIVGGAPGAELGKEGDICFDSASRTLYVKDAQRWVETEYLSCEVEENSLNVTFKDGTVKRYALSDGAETSCEHEFGEEVYTVHPATCVTPGIGVHVCTKCHNTFAVVIPADGVTHDIQPDGKCSICGEKVAFTADPDPDDPTGSVVVQGVEDSRQTKIVIPEKIEGKDVKVAAEAFKGNTTIEEVEIQGSVSVGDSAFEGCTNLESLTIQEGTESIGDNAFKDCENLENVTIPESVTSVGADAFDGTKYYTTEENWKIEEDHKVLYDASEGVLLKAKDYTAPVPAGRRNAARSGGGEYRLQADVRVIADGAFVGVENLTRVVLNEGLKTVGKGAFEGTKLEGVILPAGIENVEGLKGLVVNFYFRGVEGEWTYGSDLGENYYYFSEVPPTKEGNYWFEKDGAPVVWELTALELNYSECTTEYRLNEEFSSEGLKVTAVFNWETRVAAETFTVDSKAVNLLKAGSYDVTVTYLGVSATYSVTVKPFTVTIVYGNGTANGTATVNEGGENNYTLPAAPARTGYTFNGWKVGEGGTSDAETKITVSADVTIEAQWHVVGVNVEFSLGKGGEKGSATAKSDFKEDKYEITIQGTPTRSGYRFNGWHYEVNGASGDLGVEGGTFTVDLADEMTITVTAQWVQQVTVTYQYNNTQGKVEKTVDVGTDVELPTPEHKTGYDFDAWYVGGQKLEGETYKANSDVTLEAHWTARTPVVTVVYGDENAKGSVTASYELKEEKYTITLNGEDPTLDGSKFIGWTVSGAVSLELDATAKTFTIDLADEMNVTVTAKWTKLYTVTVTAGHATLSEELNGNQYTEGESFSFSVTVDKGYKLVSVKNGESDLTPQDGVYTVTVGTENIEITVTTEQVAVTVNYAEEGYGVTANIDRTSDPAKATITIADPSKEGYTFDKWTYQIEGGDSGTYSESLVIELANADVTVTFTAHFNFVEYTLSVAEGVAGNPQLVYTEGQKSTYHIGDTVKFKVTVDAGYLVTKVMAGDAELTAAEGVYTYTFGAASVTITVTTEEIKYTVSLKAETEHVEIGDFKVGDVTDNGPYKNGTTVTFTLTVNDPLYVITSVKNGENDLTAQDGRYSVEINGANVEITVTTDYNYGTKDAPISVSAVLTIAKDLGYNEWTKSQIYVTGKLTENPTAASDKDSENIKFTLVDLEDPSKTITVFKPTMGDGVAQPAQNDTVIVYGWVENYMGNELEFTGYDTQKKDFPQIVSNERGTSNITVTNDGATVTPEIKSTEKNGEEITFKVTVSEEGKKAVVTVNGVTVNPDGDGNYKFTVHGDMTVDIKVVDASAATETTVILNIGEYAAANNWNDASEYATSEETAIVLDDNIKVYMSTDNTQNGYYAKNSQQWRLYSGSVTFVASNGAMIQSIKITYESNKSGKLLDESGQNVDSPAEFKNVNKDSVTISMTSSGQVRITDISVTYIGGIVPSDEDKVQAAAEAYELPAENKTYSEVKIYDLPTETTGGVTITWALTGTSDYCSIDGGTKLNVTSLPEQDENVELTATFHLNGKTATNTYTVTIKAKSGGGEVKENTVTINQGFLTGWASSGYTDSLSGTDDGITYSGVALMKSGSNMQFRANKTPKGSIKNTTAYVKIKTIKITGATSGAFTLKLGTTSACSDQTISVATTSTDNTVYDSATAGGSYQYFEVACTASSGTNVLTSIEITYEKDSTGGGTEPGGEVKENTVTINQGFLTGWASSGYTDSLSSVSDGITYSGVALMKSGSNMQFRANKTPKGSIKNTTAYVKIKTIKITGATSGAFTLKLGTTSACSDQTISVATTSTDNTVYDSATAGGSYQYFEVACTASSGTNVLTSIEITYETYASDTGMEGPSVNTVANMVATLPHKEN